MLPPALMVMVDGPKIVTVGVVLGGAFVTVSVAHPADASQLSVPARALMVVWPARCPVAIPDWRTGAMPPSLELQARWSANAVTTAIGDVLLGDVRPPMA